ncbi:hypothetical protein HZB78_03545 [Candidatus Collierbacteria bacterium]|nr:hypothetical protein [Candidatus Collierbacteria bacterium]
MGNQKINQSKKEGEPTLEGIVEAWVKLCLFHIKKTKELVNQYKDKKYESKTI